MSTNSTTGAYLFKLRLHRPLGTIGFEDSSIDPLGEGQNWEVSTTLSIDSTNDILIHGVSATVYDVIQDLQNVWYTYPLGNFWPI